VWHGMDYRGAPVDCASRYLMWVSLFVMVDHMVMMNEVMHVIMAMMTIAVVRINACGSIIYLL
jgi:hypothetical protein